MFLKTVVLSDKQNTLPTAFPPLFSKKFELDTFTKQHCTFKGLPYVFEGVLLKGKLPKHPVYSNLLSVHYEVPFQGLTMWTNDCVNSREGNSKCWSNEYLHTHFEVICFVLLLHGQKQLSQFIAQLNDTRTSVRW